MSDKKTALCRECKKNWDNTPSGHIIWLCGSCSKIGDGSEFWTIKGEKSHPNLTVPEEKYIEKCKCGNEETLYTQHDNKPEYYTDVWLECKKCKQLIRFSLPVN